MQIHSEHIEAAWGLVQCGSNAAGVDGITVDLFSGDAEEQLKILLRQLRQERYEASPAKGFFIPKKTSGHRLIGIPTVTDRIVQRFLLQGIYPQLEATFTDSAFA